MSFIDTINKTVGKVGSVVKESYGPLSPLEISYHDRVGTDLRYPLDVGSASRYPHTVQFQTWLPKPIAIASSDPEEQKLFDTQGKTIGKKLVGALTSTKEKLENRGVPTEAYPGMDMKVNRNQKYNERMFDFTRRAVPSDLITMYSPVSWMDRHNNAYNEQSMTAAFGAIGAVVEAASSIMEEYKSDNDWRKNLGNMINKAGEVANGPAGMEALGGVLGGFGMDGAVIRDAGLTAMGYAMNPQFEMLYGGTNLREFQFDFIMTPRNAKEAETIRKIIKAFKWHASPEYVKGQGRYIIPPSYFDITFCFNGAESEWLPSISTCVLKTVDVDYSGGIDQWATHADGSPIQTKMTLVFAELEMMHKKLRKLGY
jgi:hypothetical protein